MYAWELFELTYIYGYIITCTNVIKSVLLIRYYSAFLCLKTQSNSLYIKQV